MTAVAAVAAVAFIFKQPRPKHYLYILTLQNFAMLATQDIFKMLTNTLGPYCRFKQLVAKKLQGWVQS